MICFYSRSDSLINEFPNRPVQRGDARHWTTIDHLDYGGGRVTEIMVLVQRVLLITLAQAATSRASWRPYSRFSWLLL
jgi:hypothetical protein